MKAKILVSACLMGFKVRYNGSDKPLIAAALDRWQQEQRLVIHCPELAAGLTTPRLPAELVGGDGADALTGAARIQESDGRDVTQPYLLAAWLALKTAQENGCQFALMTDGSPTCGSQKVYDGHFRGVTLPGAGVAAALLRQHGIEVYAGHQLPALISRIEEFEKEPQ
ncbi:DUF523 domain-containing protein [Enterobacteriaceae bacterium H20N1]|uniref:DUF523 domain-containing protein n=1 Tax=Dryocola boscaweniae TaxID=2925397 RepID=A0A9X3APF5_9ENTR|nr:DUF523 domain-containing protein [Dryocola boscaweniae]MCT4704152.1 DUF523 domain-containing protein [Dryocola boscaweniae]MCT4717334.1 DUF523 domain-containing protein [Dryocola boscaweniae]MCT4721320.1 DUF523 domain-containing protein [Dryocola boscaweniae]